MWQLNDFGEIVKTYQTSDTPTGDVVYQTSDGRVWTRDYEGDATGKVRGLKIGNRIYKKRGTERSSRNER